MATEPNADKAKERLRQSTQEVFAGFGRTDASGSAPHDRLVSANQSRSSEDDPSGDRSTARQLETARHLVEQIARADIRVLVDLAQQVDKPIVEMSSDEADELIERL